MSQESNTDDGSWEVCEPETLKQQATRKKNELFQNGENAEAILISDIEGKAITTKKLTELFKNVQHYPVAFYSIAGAFRKGKSFMLNLFIKYLESNQQGNSWIETKDTDLGGFAWGGGMSAKTQGVLIYSKYFIIKNQHGQKVAVFLMDTQGMFDGQTTLHKCTAIFALSTLISSVQIYNLSHQIQDDNLQYLQLFTDYGRMQQQRRSGHDKPFQNLILLIRDWHDPSVKFGQDGGKVVLDKWLGTDKTANEEIHGVRKYIKDCFENISCILLPYPGKCLAERPAERQEVKFSEVQQEFKNEVTIFIKNLFSPNHLVPKHIGGKQATGSSIITFIESLVGSVTATHVPQIGTLFQNAKEQTAIKALEQCYILLEQKINSLHHREPPVCQEEAEQIVCKIEENVLEVFKLGVLLGDEHFKLDLEGKLKEKMQEKFLLFKLKNTERIKQFEQQYEEKVEKLIEKYSKIMFEEGVCLETLSISTLREKHNETYKVIVDLFVKEVKNLDQRAVSKWTNVLHNQLESTFNKKFFEFYEHQKKIKEDMHKLMMECYKGFTNQLPKQKIEDRSKFTDMFNEKRDHAMEKLRSGSIEYDRLFVKEYEEKLEGLIATYTDINTMLQVDAKHYKIFTWYENMSKMEKVYNDAKIHDWDKEKYLTEEATSMLHDKCCKAVNICAEELFEEMALTAEEKKMFKEKLRSLLDNQLILLKYSNKETLENLQLDYKLLVQKYLEYYQKLMNECIYKLTEEEMRGKHTFTKKEAIDKLLEDFNENRESPLCEKYLTNLEDAIQTEFEHNALKILRKKNEMSDAISQVRIECVQTYTNHMKERLLKPASDLLFEEYHKQAEKMALWQFGKDQRKIGGSSNNVKEDLLKQVQTEKYQLAVMNLTKREMAKNLAAKDQETALVLYMNLMSKSCERGHISTDEFLNEHAKNQDESLRNFENGASTQTMYDFKDYEADLIKAIQSQQRIMLSENENRKEQALGEMAKTKYDLMRKYDQNMQYRDYVDEQKLQNDNMNLTTQLLQDFDRSHDDCLVEYANKFRLELISEMNREFSHIEERNKQNKEKLEAKLRKNANLTCKNFRETFSELTEYLEESECKRRLQSERKKAVLWFNANADAPKSMVETAKLDLEKGLDDCTQNICRENSKNKEYADIAGENAKNAALICMKSKTDELLKKNRSMKDATTEVSHVVNTAMEEFWKKIGMSTRKFKTDRFQRETNKDIETLRRTFLEDVNDQITKRENENDEKIQIKIDECIEEFCQNADKVKQHFTKTSRRDALLKEKDRIEREYQAKLEELDCKPWQKQQLVNVLDKELDKIVKDIGGCMIQ